MGLSLYSHLQQKEKLAINFLLLGAFLLRLLMTGLDDFLHDWDERYHALVAKNMLLQPFSPMLRAEPVLPYNYQNWTQNHIWLHKQPLFLWQMALSMRIFGVNEMALRLPSAFMGLLTVFSTYQIGKIVTTERIAYISAFLLTFAFYQLKLTSGAHQIDHNDVVFLGYVTASIWAVLAFQQAEKKAYSWLILIGMLVGCAVLTKWLTGCVVYAAWGIAVLLDKEKGRQIAEYGYIAISFALTCLVALPWQIYIAVTFPPENTWERDYNWRHVTEVVEGHTAPVWYYLDETNYQYGAASLILILVGAYFFWKKSSYSWGRNLIFLSVGMVYFFFSVIAKSIGSSYVYVMAALLYLWQGAAVEAIISRWENRFSTKLFFTGILLFFALYAAGFDRLYHRIACDKNIEERLTKENERKTFQKLDSLLPEKQVIFNTKAEIEAMFYSHHNYYTGWLTEAQYQELKQKGYKMAYFSPENEADIPVFLKNDTEIKAVFYE